MAFGDLLYRIQHIPSGGQTILTEEVSLWPETANEWKDLLEEQRAHDRFEGVTTPSFVYVDMGSYRTGADIRKLFSIEEVA